MKRLTDEALMQADVWFKSLVRTVSQETTLVMRRPGRGRDEKGFHFHHWKLTGEDDLELEFTCMRCMEIQRLPHLKEGRKGI